jgi:tetratricopeptide (TPR) repeat protein
MKNPPIVLCIILILSVCAQAPAQAPPSTPSPCNNREIVRSLLGDKNALALAETRACIDYFRRLTANLTPTTHPPSFDQASDVLQLAHHLCSVAQIHAIMGHKAEARSALTLCENMDRDWAGLTHSFLITQGWVEMTRGFVLELGGDVTGARRAYLEAESYCGERLAMISLASSDTEAAIKWASKALKGDPKNPTAYVALAAGFERAGSPTEALQSYRQALAYFDEAATKSNEFFPVFYYEHTRAKEAIGRLAARP